MLIIMTIILSKYVQRYISKCSAHSRLPDLLTWPTEWSKRFEKRGNGKSTRIIHKLAWDLHQPLAEFLALVLDFGTGHSEYSGHSSRHYNAHVCI